MPPASTARHSNRNARSERGPFPRAGDVSPGWYQRLRKDSCEVRARAAQAARPEEGVGFWEPADQLTERTRGSSARCDKNFKRRKGLRARTTGILGRRSGAVNEMARKTLARGDHAICAALWQIAQSFNDPARVSPRARSFPPFRPRSKREAHPMSNGAAPAPDLAARILQLERSQQ